MRPHCRVHRRSNQDRRLSRKNYAREHVVAQAGGEELATQGVTINFGALPYRAKCLALVAVDGQAPRIIAADDAVREWAAQADGGRRVAVQGAAGRKGRLLVYHPATKVAETIEATFGADGRAVVDLGR
jgi:hypothetical protein